MPQQTSTEFDYKQHVRDGGKLTFEEFKARKKKMYRDREIRFKELLRTLDKKRRARERQT